MVTMVADGGAVPDRAGLDAFPLGAHTCPGRYYTLSGHHWVPAGDNCRPVDGDIIPHQYW
ncbi:MAG: hypothetical protein KatS3mg054_1281 [Chloroflexus sp.]|nr:MAG: hypothetical protein KatS3mg054_1281 [Chloroflexus sp.]